MSDLSTAYGMALKTNPYREKAGATGMAIKNMGDDPYGYSSIAKIPLMYMLGKDMGQAAQYDKDTANAMGKAFKDENDKKAFEVVFKHWLELGKINPDGADQYKGDVIADDAGKNPFLAFIKNFKTLAPMDKNNYMQFDLGDKIAVIHLSAIGNPEVLKAASTPMDDTQMQQVNAALKAKGAAFYTKGAKPDTPDVTKIGTPEARRIAGELQDTGGIPTEPIDYNGQQTTAKDLYTGAMTKNLVNEPGGITLLEKSADINKKETPTGDVGLFMSDPKKFRQMKKIEGESKPDKPEYKTGAALKRLSALGTAKARLKSGNPLDQLLALQLPEYAGVVGSTDPNVINAAIKQMDEEENYLRQFVPKSTGGGTGQKNNPLNLTIPGR